MNWRVLLCAGVWLLIQAMPVQAVSAQARQIWKVAGQSVYGDAPPRLHLQGVQLFDPRTGKLSKVINEKPRRPSEKLPEPPSEPEVIEADDQEEQKIEAMLTAADQAKTISPEEQQRRNDCQAAQQQLSLAASDTGANRQEAEAAVVQYCIAAE